jgi:hypothetical protein
LSITCKILSLAQEFHGIAEILFNIQLKTFTRHNVVASLFATQNVDNPDNHARVHSKMQVFKKHIAIIPIQGSPIALLFDVGRWGRGRKFLL